MDVQEAVRLRSSLQEELAGVRAQLEWLGASLVEQQERCVATQAQVAVLEAELAEERSLRKATDLDDVSLRQDFDRLLEAGTPGGGRGWGQPGCASAAGCGLLVA